MGCSFRPGEYLIQSPPRDIEEVVNSSLTVFWFHEVAYPVCSPQLYPKDLLPEAMATLLDASKNDKLGKGGPRAVYKNVNRTSPNHFCCVYELFQFLSQYPPLPNTPLLSGCPVPITSTIISQVLRVTALRLGLDPERLLPHSFRLGALEQLAAAPDETKMMQGNWHSAQGMRVYVRRSLFHAASIASDLYNHGICPLAHTKFMYATPFGQRLQL